MKNTLLSQIFFYGLFLSSTYGSGLYSGGVYGVGTTSSGTIHLGPLELPATGATVGAIGGAVLIAVAAGLIAWVQRRRKVRQAQNQDG